MKKLLVLFLAFMMVFALVACKSDPAEETDSTATEDAGKAALVEQGSSSSSKGVDNNGFKIVGTYNLKGKATKVEVGGKDDLYWIGQYSSADDAEATSYVYFRMKDENTVSYYTGSGWIDFSADSIKEALFSETGVFSKLVDNVLYLSFELESTGLFGDLAYAGQATYNGMTCSKYTATFSNDELGDIATATVYLEPTYAVTVGFEFSLTESFASNGALAQTTLESLFNYEADADFSIDTSDIPDYEAVSATITN